MAPTSAPDTLGLSEHRARPPPPEREDTARPGACPAGRGIPAHKGKTQRRGPARGQDRKAPPFGRRAADPGAGGAGDGRRTVPPSCRLPPARSRLRWCAATHRTERRAPSGGWRLEGRAANACAERGVSRGIADDRGDDGANGVRAGRTERSAGAPPGIVREPGASVEPTSRELGPACPAPAHTPFPVAPRLSASTLRLKGTPVAAQFQPPHPGAALVPGAPRMR